MSIICNQKLTHWLKLTGIYSDVWCTERPLTVVIRPLNGSSVRAGDKVRCSVEENVSSADNNYTWIDSSTGHVIHHDSAEWTVRPCSHQSSISTAHDDDDDEMMETCVNTTDGLLLMECHVTVGMTTARGTVMLYLEESTTSCTSVTTAKS